MNIETRLGVNSLGEIIDYFSKNNFQIDYNKYKFVLTDEEIYILNEFLKNYLEHKKLDYDMLSNTLFYDLRLTKVKPDIVIVARLLLVAYKKIRHIDNLNINEEKMKNISFLSAINMKSNNDSISLYEYNKYSNDGTLFAATSRLERFIIKYRIGMMYMYKKLKLPQDLDLDFYQDLATFCHQLGYTDKYISKYQIDNYLLYINDYLVKIKSIVDTNNVINDYDLVRTFIDEQLSKITDHLRKEEPIIDFQIIIASIDEKIDYLKYISKPYIVNEIENERRLEN